MAWLRVVSNVLVAPKQLKDIAAPLPSLAVSRITFATRSHIPRHKRHTRPILVKQILEATLASLILPLVRSISTPGQPRRTSVLPQLPRRRSLLHRQLAQKLGPAAMAAAQRRARLLAPSLAALSEAWPPLVSACLLSSSSSAARRSPRVPIKLSPLRPNSLPWRPMPHQEQQ